MSNPADRPATDHAECRHEWIHMVLHPDDPNAGKWGCAYCPAIRDAAPLDLYDAARAILPEVIDSELPSAITSDDPMAGIERMKAIGDRWERLRAALSEGAAPRAEGLDVERLRKAIHRVYGPVEAEQDTEAIAAEYDRDAD